MIQGKSVLGVIPARGGSKGIRRKNVRMLAGKPLIAWTILEAGKSRFLDRFILSSEDPDIILVARSFNCDVPFIRPEELARDETPGIEPVLHAINAVGNKYDYVVLLQPTSPLRQADDIDACIQCCVSHHAPACVSVTAAEKSPYWMYTIDQTGRLSPIIKAPEGQKLFRRQDLSQAYALNGAVYVAGVDWIVQHRSFLSDETIAHVMPRERSLDVDTEFDLSVCEFLLAEKNGGRGVTE